MNTKNLIPLKLIALKQRQRALRRWLIINGSYAALLTAVWVIYTCSRPVITPHESTQSLRVELIHSNATLKSLKRTSDEFKFNFQSNKEITHREDWSVFLTTISRSLDQESVLKVLDCTPDPTAGTHFTATSSFWPESLRISGIARSQQSVTRFVLKLESLGFFSVVRIVQTGAQSLGGGAAIGFDLICTFPNEAVQP